MYLLLDANVTAGYYLPRSLNSKKAKDRIANIFDSARSGRSDFFFYLPNFCVAEVFSVFMKHSFGAWNSHVKKKGDRKSTRLNSSHVAISYAVFCLKTKTNTTSSPASARPR